jgi:hypothetical protein
VDGAPGSPAKRSAGHHCHVALESRSCRARWAESERLDRFGGWSGSVIFGEATTMAPIPILPCVRAAPLVNRRAWGSNDKSSTTLTRFPACPFGPQGSDSDSHRQKMLHIADESAAFRPSSAGNGHFPYRLVFVDVVATAATPLGRAILPCGADTYCPVQSGLQRQRRARHRAAKGFEDPCNQVAPT